MIISEDIKKTNFSYFFYQLYARNEESGETKTSEIFNRCIR